MTWRKLGALSCVVAALAGCARTQQGPMAGGGKWTRVTEADLLDAPEAMPPNILPETHYAAGQLFEAQGLYGKAIQQYQRATLLNHNYAQAYHRLGVLLGRVGRHEQALAALQKAAEISPQDAVIRNDLGYELATQSHWAQAEEHLRAAIDTRPNFRRAHINLGLVLTKLDRIEDALATFQQVLPEPDAYYNVGLLLRGEKRYQDAAACFEQVLRLDPQFIAAATQLEEIRPKLLSAQAEEIDAGSETEVTAVEATPDQTRATAVVAAPQSEVMGSSGEEAVAADTQVTGTDTMPEEWSADAGTALALSSGEQNPAAVAGEPEIAETTELPAVNDAVTPNEEIVGADSLDEVDAGTWEEPAETMPGQAAIGAGSESQASELAVGDVTTATTAAADEAIDYQAELERVLAEVSDELYCFAAQAQEDAARVETPVLFSAVVPEGFYDNDPVHGPSHLFPPDAAADWYPVYVAVMELLSPAPTLAQNEAIPPTPQGPVDPVMQPSVYFGAFPKPVTPPSDQDE